MNSHPVPQFLHIKQMMASHRELGQSSMESGMDEEFGGRSRGSKSLRDMLCLGSITHFLVTRDTYLLLKNLQTYAPRGRDAFWDP